MIMNNLKVASLAYRLYFKTASWPVKISSAARLIKHRFAGITAPISVMIGLTYRCQCDCVHCGMDLYRVDPAEELSPEEVKNVIRQARELGAVEITFFGGEPLLRKDLEELVAFASSLKMLPSIDTNGLLLTSERIRKLMDAGLAAVKVSLDSPDAAEHDRLRGVPGCFEKALAITRECAQKGLPCVISTYASRENLESGDLKKLIELGRELGVDAVRIIDTTLSGCFISSPGLTLKPDEREELAKLLEPGFVFLENLASARAITHPICSAMARRYIYVSPRGDVQPCCFVPLAFGNIRNEPLKDLLERLWKSAVMAYDCNQCLMNNPEFREHHLSSIEAADSLPITFKG